MTLVQRCAVATADSRLEGLIGKLMALRAEIDATLADLAVYKETALAEAGGTIAAAGAVIDEPEVHAAATGHDDLPQPRAPADAVERSTAPLALANALGSNSHDAAEEMPCGHSEPTIDQARREEGTLAVASDPAPAIEKPCAVARALSMPASPQDDLTLISSIDAGLAGRLNAHGIATHAQIALWNEQDVKSVSEALDLGRRISKENWIEQAALLAAGQTTAFANRRDALAVASGPAGSLPALESAGAEKPAAAAKIAPAVAVAAERIETAQVIAFDSSARRPQHAGKAQPAARRAAGGTRRRRRVALVATAVAACLIAAVLLTNEGGALTEQARTVVSQSVRSWLASVTFPIEPVWQAPDLRPEPYGARGSLAPAGFELLRRHHQTWPPGS